MTNPVWSIKPNWANSVTETLEWLTDVLTQVGNGVEQRRALRRSPRRYFEFTANPFNNERTYLDLLMQQMQNQTFSLPLWHDKGRLSAATAAGAVRLNFDNKFREHVVGGLAILYQDAFTYDVVTVAGVDDAGLDVSATTLDWKKGAAIYPLRDAFITDAGSYTVLSPIVGQVQIKFQLVGTNDIDPGDEVLALYNGSPVFNKQPDWQDDLTFTMTTLEFPLDNTFGQVYRGFETRRAFSSQAWSAFAVGRAQQFALRQMLYRQAGRAKDLWMPTFATDMRVISSPAAGKLDIGKIGMGLIGGPVPGRERIVFPSTGEVAQITGLEGTGSLPSERLVLSAPLVNNYPRGAVASFLAYSRFDSDSIEIEHQRDSNGPISVKVPVRNIPEGRDPSGTIYLPIPAAAMSLESCGQPEDGSCTTVFEGWYWRYTFTVDRSDDSSQQLFAFSVGMGDFTHDGNWHWTSLDTEDKEPGTALTLQWQFGSDFYNDPFTPSAVCDIDFYEHPCIHITAQYWTSSTAVDITPPGAWIGRLYPFDYPVVLPDNGE